MEITLTTPSLLFPAISLLLLAYTNRFLAIANLIRGLHAKYNDTHDPLLLHQIRSLRRRVLIIRNMQATGILSILLCVVSMYLIFAGYPRIATYTFSISMLSLIVSLSLSLIEIQVSVNALNLQLSDLEELQDSRQARKWFSIRSEIQEEKE